MCYWKNTEEIVNLFLCTFFCDSNEQTAITHLHTRKDAIHHIEREQLIEIPIITNKEFIEEWLVINKMELTSLQ